MRRIAVAVVFSIGLFGLAGCEEARETELCFQADRDWALETLEVALPSAPAVNFDRLPKALIAAHYVGPYRVVALLAKGDVGAVQAHWDGMAQMTDRSEQMRAVVRTLDAMYGRGATSLHQAQAWHAAEPTRPAAQLTLAMAWAHAAYETKWEKVGKSDRASHYFRYKSRTEQATTLLDELVQRNDLYGLAARELNLRASTTRRWDGASSARAWDNYLELITYAPQYEWLYLRAADHAAGLGDAALREQRFEQLESLAHSHALPLPHRVTLEQAIEAYVNPPDQNPNPQSWRPYWTARIDAAPTIYNYAGWMEAEYKLHNWADMVGLAEKILALHPHHKRAFELKSYGLREMGESQKAYVASVEGMMVGSDWSANQLIQAYTRGGLGVPIKDFESMYALCTLGANLALPSAANCMGAAHSEGFAGAERNDQKALAWHLLAARGGHSNSAHDVAVLMPRVVNNPKQANEVAALTDHWLRSAAAQDHTAAKNKLSARPPRAKACEPVDASAWKAMLLRILTVVLR